MYVLVIQVLVLVLVKAVVSFVVGAKTETDERDPKICELISLKDRIIGAL